MRRLSGAARFPQSPLRRYGRHDQVAKNRPISQCCKEKEDVCGLTWELSISEGSSSTDWGHPCCRETPRMFYVVSGIVRGTLLCAGSLILLVNTTQHAGSSSSIAPEHFHLKCVPFFLIFRLTFACVSFWLPIHSVGASKSRPNQVRVMKRGWNGSCAFWDSLPHNVCALSFPNLPSPTAVPVNGLIRRLMPRKRPCDFSHVPGVLLARLRRRDTQMHCHGLMWRTSS